MRALDQLTACFMLTLWPWRWRQYVLPKRLLTTWRYMTEDNSVVITVRISDAICWFYRVLRKMWLHVFNYTRRVSFLVSANLIPMKRNLRYRRGSHKRSLPFGFPATFRTHISFLPPANFILLICVAVTESGLEHKLWWSPLILCPASTCHRKLLSEIIIDYWLLGLLISWRRCKGMDHTYFDALSLYFLEWSE